MLPSHILRAKVRLVPNLEVANVEFISVAPAFVVMADDAQADLRPLPVIGRFVHPILPRRVLDALAQPIHHLGADGVYRFHITSVCAKR